LRRFGSDSPRSPILWKDHHVALARFREDEMARTVTVQWMTGMKASMTTGPHQVVFDAPPEAGGGDEGPSPAEMLLGAIGA